MAARSHARVAYERLNLIVSELDPLAVDRVDLVIEYIEAILTGNKIHPIMCVKNMQSVAGTRRRMYGGAKTERR